MRQYHWMAGCLIALLALVLFIFQIPKRAVVSGQSISGMMAALILAKSGYEVDVYEMRDDYTRNIQWAARQSLVDELASIDEKLAELFYEKVAGPLDRGSIHIYPDGSRKEKRHDGLRRPNPAILPKCGIEMMSSPSVVNMEAKVFEEFLREYLLSLPNIRWHRGSMRLKRFGDSYCVEDLCVPDLIVIAEGAHSATRSALGIRSFPVTDSRMQISGAIGVDGGGVMVKHWRREGGRILLTGTMGRKGCGKTWIVGDIDPSILTSQEKIDREFRRLAAASLEIALENLDKCEIFGMADGKPIQIFPLRQMISEMAAIGDNVILMGDAVGSGHWSVGGGMQIGAVCHAERLKILLQDIDLGMLRKKALQKYSDGALGDTIAWGITGLKDFYPMDGAFDNR